MFSLCVRAYVYVFVNEQILERMNFLSVLKNSKSSRGKHVFRGVLIILLNYSTSIFMHPVSNRETPPLRGLR